jgi:hypothetical protein
VLPKQGINPLLAEQSLHISDDGLVYFSKILMNIFHFVYEQVWGYGQAMPYAEI